jgi:hypothetical protein
LGIVGKNAIDTKGLQAVGTNLTFYLMKRPTENIYSMTELDHIRFPTSLNELKGIHGYIDNICDIMNAFSKECSNPVLKEAIMHRSSMISPLLRAITSKVLIGSARIALNTTACKLTSFSVHKILIIS